MHIVFASLLLSMAAYILYLLFKSHSEDTDDISKYKIEVYANKKLIVNNLLEMPLKDKISLSLVVSRRKDGRIINFAKKFVASSSEPTTAKVLPSGRDILSDIFADDVNIMVKSRNKKILRKQVLAEFTLRVLPGDPEKIEILLEESYPKDGK